MSDGEEIKESPVNNAPPTRKRRRWKSALLGLVILFCGIVIGAGITLHAGSLLLLHAVGPEVKIAQRVTRHLDRDLDLTDEQRAQVVKIVGRRISAFQHIVIDAHARAKEEYELLHDEVAAILTGEQKISWEKHYKKMQEASTRIHKRLLPDHR